MKGIYRPFFERNQTEATLFGFPANDYNSLLPLPAKSRHSALKSALHFRRIKDKPLTRSAHPLSRAQALAEIQNSVALDLCLRGGDDWEYGRRRASVSPTLMRNRAEAINRTRVAANA